MEASYGLALNGDRFFCRDTASTDYDSCVACCVSATRIGTKVARKDVTGFLASNIIAGRTVCVCCIPNAFDEPYE
uniref:Uncharacterized protein n=1 Tax=Plectus sambesii TaxID=2011161 RepID=A0A914X5D1_9BILA